MTPRGTRNRLSLAVVLGLILPSCSAMNVELSASTTVTEQDAGPVPFQRIVEFERAVHFQSTEGKDTIVPPGSYTVEVVEQGLRLSPSDKEGADAFTLQAQPVTHQEAVEADEPVTLREGDDQQIVMVLMPGGKAWQASGTYSGVQARGPQMQALPAGPLILQHLPKIIGIFTVPQLAALSPGGTLYIKGDHFGSSKGKVTLSLSVPVSHTIDLAIEEWSDIKIKAKIPSNVSGVMDHPATFQVRAASGFSSSAWKVPFYATRTTKVLTVSDPAVKIVACSTAGDRNKCNHLDTSTGGSCFAKAIIPVILTTSFYAQHVNCDVAVDWDKGKDRFDVTLRNGWVFKNVEFIQNKSSTSEKIDIGDYTALRHNLPGTSSWKPEISWEVSPGPDQLEYGFWLTIEGPKGVPHY